MNSVMAESVMDVPPNAPLLSGHVGKTLTCAIVVRVEDPNTRLNKFVLIGWVRYVWILRISNSVVWRRCP